MRLIVGVTAIAIGYALLYYGVVMYKYYNSTSGTSQGIPLSSLLGIPGRQGDAAADWAQPPFHGNITRVPANSGTSNSTPANQSPFINPAVQSA